MKKQFNTIITRIGKLHRDRPEDRWMKNARGRDKTCLRALKSLVKRFKPLKTGPP